MKKFLAVLAAACLVFGMVGCQQTNDVSTGQDVQDSIETVEMKTIEPPENGWTLEDLLSVTYIYGSQLTVPCTLENLGDDFSFDTSDFKEHCERNVGITTLNYKSIPIAGVSVNEINMKKINSNTEILNAFFSLLFENDNENNIIVNGIDFNCTKNQVISSFGEPNVSKENFISYFNAGTEERILAFNFDNEGNVIGIHIILYDYV